MISVLIPCYNSAATIRRAINSVLNQTYKEYEIIVIEDGSREKEETQRLVLEYKDARIKFIQHPANKNGSAARNTGILNSKGDFIAFLDADDEWLSNHLEESLKLLLGIKKNSADPICIYSKSIVKKNGFADLILPQFAKQRQEKIADYLFCNKGFIPTPSLFLSSEVTKKIKWNEQLIRHQDYDFLFQMEQIGVEVIMSDHIGTIIHWEDNDVAKKGGTWDYSLSFAKKMKAHFSDKSYTCFILKNTVYPLFQNGKKGSGWKIFRAECSFTFISLKEKFFFFNYLFFGKLLFSKIYSSIKK